MSWVLQPCSDACVSCGSFNITVLPYALFFFFSYSEVKIQSLLPSFSVVVFVYLVKLAQGARIVANYANRVIKVQYCSYCHGEINSEFKNISVQLCICMLS